MNTISSLHSLGIEWKSSPRLWNLIPIQYIPTCDSAGKVHDVSGNYKYTLYAVRSLGHGKFGKVDAYKKVFPDTSEQIVAIKRPIHKKLGLLVEGLFQWKLHTLMKGYGLEFAVPEVYDIVRFKVSDDIWIVMEAFEPYLLSHWCVQNLGSDPNKLFGLLILQIAIVLEVFETELKINHRDLKVNNMLIVNENVTLVFNWNNKKHTLKFPFRIVFVDFGFACIQQLLDIRNGEGLAPLDACPKKGRDIFHVLASIWRIPLLRDFLNSYWGEWIRERLCDEKLSYVEDTETKQSLDWLHRATENPEFCSPMCAPAKIIEECLMILEEIP